MEKKMLARVPLLTISTRPYATVLLLIVSDLVALMVAIGISLALRDLYDLGVLLPQSYVRLFPVLFVFILIYAAVDLYPGVVLYPGVALGPVEELRRLTVCTTLMFLGLAASSFLAGGTEVYSRAVWLMSWLIGLLTVPSFRGFLRMAFAHRSWWGHPAVLVGAGATARRVISALRRAPGLGLKIVAVLDDRKDLPQDVAGVPVIGGISLAPELAREGVPYAIVAMSELPRERHDEVLVRYSQLFPHLLIIPELFALSTLWVVAKDLGGVLGLEVREQLLLPGPCRAKRCIDLVLTLVGGVAILPLLMLVGLLIKLDSPGPIWFTQERMGRGGQTFKTYKFRTMCVGAEEQLERILSEDPARRDEYETFHKLRDDPRVTRVGRLLRKYSLDELLQLWNVIRGEMSLVGPRAYLPSEVGMMEKSDPVILRVRPGITGIWQVSGRNDVSFSERLAMDVYYVRNWSLWFDLHILARTGWVVLHGKGAC